jgi:hypothetical protein
MSSGLAVSENGRYLVHDDGSPFFYLGDTAWELFHRSNREQARFYLRNRAAKRFTVIQAVVLAEVGGLSVPNAQGALPLVDSEPSRPNEDYFAHVDFIVAEAEALGLYVGMLPTWGKYVTNVWGEDQVIFDPDNARTYGRYLGERYRDAPVIWILGGDRPAPGVQEVWRAMARGLREGDAGRHLITYHPQGQHSSAMWLHDEPWLDFNMLQSGHHRRVAANYRMIEADYHRSPAKPCLDGEPCYEDHPINWEPTNGWFDDHDVRRAAYWALFAGAHGHTYGCHDIWQMYMPGEREPVMHARTSWLEALDLPGAYDMKHVRDLMLSRPFATRIPDQRMILEGVGQAWDHVQATRDGTPEQGKASFLMAYVPTSKRVTLDTSVISADSVHVWWFDPREGVAEDWGSMPNKGTYQAPRRSSGPDWVIVIDDAAAGYPPPGQGVLT